MSKCTKMWLIIATSLVTVGMGIFVIVMSINKWDFSKLATGKYETNTYEISQEYTNISLETITADVRFEISEDGTSSVVVYEQEKVKHSVEVVGDTLTINVDDQRKWYEYIGVAFGAPRITIYLPSEDYVSDMKIKTTTGDINIEDMKVNSMGLQVTTGDIKISDVDCDNNIKIKVTTGDTKILDTTCKKMNLDGNTGDVFLRSVIVEGALSIERNTGDVEFEDCDAGEIYIETDTGDVEGTLLTNKVFIAETDTGEVDVPKSKSGGICEIDTDTGDIEISISK